MKKDIYKIINKINGKIYIGQSVDPVYRFRKSKFLSDESVKEIHRLLLEKRYSIQYIANKFGVLKNTIININSGLTKRYYDPNLEYPLR